MTGSWDQAMLGRNDIEAYQNASKVHTLVDSYMSKGNFIQDADGNVLLDLCSTENLPLGHNSEAFIKNLKSNKHMDLPIINSSLDAGARPSHDFAPSLAQTLKSVAPENLSKVTLTQGGNAVE